MSVSAPLTDEATAVFRFGDFLLDGKSHVLLRDGERQHLSPKAWQLLYLLLTAWPSARSRQEIYDELWPSTFVCETNMAGVVSELRRVLGDDARAAQYIRTVHGYGYAFCGDVAVTAPQSRVRATLVCEGQSYLLYEGANSVGRSPDCRVILTNRSVSRHHAVITIQGDAISLEDLGSRNGTYIDTRRIESGRLTPQNRIIFGAVEAVIMRRKLSTTTSLHLKLPELQREIAKRLASV